MAKFNGNIFNRALGSIGGNTFSQARYRRGKLQTGRQRVAPSNPRTIPQQQARENFRDSIRISSDFRGNGNYLAFDNAVSKLPAFQSITSIMQHMKSVGSFGISFTNLYRTIPRSPLAGIANIGITNPSQNGDYILNLASKSGVQSPNDEVLIAGLGLTISATTPPDFRTQIISVSRSEIAQVEMDMGGYGGAKNNAVFIIWAKSIVKANPNRFSEINFYTNEGSPLIT